MILTGKKNGKTISVRINGLDTHYMYKDLIDIVTQAGQHIDTILIPKVGVRDDVYMVDCLLSQLEDETNLKNKIGIECLIQPQFVEVVEKMLM